LLSHIKAPLREEKREVASYPALIYQNILPMARRSLENLEEQKLFVTG
jgi:hypothetical protein